MKVLVAHTYYRQRGGEDGSFEVERRLLVDHGHEMVSFVRQNDNLGAMTSVRAAAATIWNRAASHDLTEVLERERPDVVHFQNTFPLLSPAIYRAARAGGAAVVETLRNYRITCVNGLLYRDGRVCELCLGRRFAVHGVRYGCYRDDRAASAVVATMNLTHHLVGTWQDAVDRYIVLSDFARDKLRSVLPVDKLAVKPNFLHPDPGPARGTGGYAIFVGRLSEEKGVRTLLRAWERLTDEVPLVIVGDGDLEDEVRTAADRSRGTVRFVGRLSTEEVLEQVGAASFLVFPSQWYEGMPRTIIEAFARGTPVIASRLGTPGDMVDDGVTGRLVEPGSVQDLTRAVQELARDREGLRGMRERARDAFVERYSADRNHDRLVEIYQQAIASRAADG